MLAHPFAFKPQMGTLPATSSTQQQQQSKIFDFTKRKRWADILVNEISGAIILVLTHDGKVIFCGEGAKELVGWKDEVLDNSVTELIHRKHAHATASQRPAEMLIKSQSWLL
jgi:PAS domain-containing protein